MAKRPPGLVYDDADIDAVVRTMLGEAAGEGDEGLAAVAHVLVNRLEKGGYGGSLYKVAHAPKQFSAWNSSGSGGNSLVDLPEDDPRYIEARAIAEEVLNGRREDNTGGAVNYFAPKGMTGKDGTKKGDPDWASRMSYTTTIGGHKFYSDGSAAAAAENMANGGDVAGLQQQLAQRGFDPGAIDGVKGPRTTAAIKAFQKANGLEADGIVGPRTLAALNSQREPGSLETALSGMGVPAAFGVRGNSGATSPDEIARTPDGFTAAAPGDVRDDARLITLGRPAGSVDPVGAGPRLGDLLRMRSAIPAPVTEADTRAEQRTLGTGSPAGPVLGFKPFAAPAPLTAPAMDDTGYRPTFGGVQQLGVTPPAAPGTPTAPTTPPSPTGGGFDLGSMLGGLGNTLGQTAQNVGKTLGTTATNVVEGTKAGLEKTAESVKDTLTNELIGTVKGRTLLMNTALGIEPRRDPAAERRISAPEGFAYGATGKKLYKIGQTYNSSRGQVVFDGAKFVPAGTQVRSSVDIPPANATSRRASQQADYARRGLNEFGMLS